MIKLIVASGETARELSLDDSSVIVGRTAECQVRFDDSRVSRQHAKIEKADGAWLCSDLGSGNGTRVNDVPIKAPTPLRRGDVVMIGHNSITIVDMDVPDPPPSSVAIPLPPPPAAVEAPAAPARSGLSRVFTLALMGGAGLAATVLVVALVVSSRRPPATTAEPAPTMSVRDRELREANAALEKFRDKVTEADLIGDDLVSEAKKLGGAYNDILRSGRADAAPPFDQLLSTLLTKQAGQRATRVAGLAKAVDDALSTKKYAEAIAALRDFHASADPSFEPALHELIDRVDRVVDEDMARVRRKGESLEAYEQYAQAADHYRTQQTRFRGTKYEPVFTGRPELLGEMAKLAASAPRATPRATPEPSTPPTTGLVGLMIAPISGGALANRLFAFSPELRGSPVAADKTGVTVKREGTTVLVAWPSVPAPIVFAMAAAALKGDDLLAVADFGYGLGLRYDADVVLHRLLLVNPACRSRADVLIARSRQKPAPPKGGYLFHPARGWEEPEEREGREAETEASFLCSVLDDATEVKLLDPVVARLAAILQADTMPAASRHRIEVESVQALKASKEAHLKVIAEKTKGMSASLEKLRAAKRKLNEARAAAIKLIYDESKYLREDHPDFPKGDTVNGQAEVDKKVDEVRKLWESAGTVVATMDPAMKKEIELVRAINDEYLVTLGDPPDEAEMKEYEEILSNLNSKINLKTFCSNSSEAAQYKWNRGVDSYNQALKDPAVGESEKAHADVVNDYREMMGRRRLFLDAKLCKATRGHSTACNAAGKIWHVGSDGDPQSRAQAQGFAGGVGENVCLGYGDSDTWTRGWYRASDHHRNGLLENYNCMGYGYVGNVGTENFSTIGAPF